MNRVVQRDEAEEDLIEVFVFLGEKNPSSARHFVRAAEDTFQTLAEQPGMGKTLESKNPDLQGVRWFPVKDFPKVLVYYRPLTDGVEVLRVLHGARDLASLLGA